MKKTLLILSFSFLVLTGYSQTKKELRIFKRIYGAIIDSNFAHYWKSKPVYFILIDSSINDYISKYDYSGGDLLGRRDPILADSSWKLFFKEADDKKKSLRHFKLPRIRSSQQISVADWDSVKSVSNKSGITFWDGFHAAFNWADGYMRISDVILSKKKDKAIVEMSYHQGSLEGGGSIFFLQKTKKGKWEVIRIFPTWVS